MTAGPSPDSLIASARVFILSGGAAKRAGGMNKSLIEVEGQRIIEHQIERLAAVFPNRPILITDRGEDYAAYGLETLSDFDEASPEERFALRGFARALAATGEGWAFLLAADMPWPDPDLIHEQARWLAARSGEGAEPQGLVLEDGGYVQPFHAFYRGTLADSARAALQAGDRSLQRWIRSEAGIAVRPSGDFEPAGRPGFRGFTGFNAPPGKGDSKR